MKKEIKWLQEKMKRRGIDYCVITTGDYHNSEYVNAYFKVREFFSGFTGSNGTLVVSGKEAGLWTDGRYFIQAERELAGSGIVLYRMGEEKIPTIEEYLCASLTKGQVLAFDGMVVSASFGLVLEKLCAQKGSFVRYKEDLAAGLWTDRPQMPHNPMYALKDAISGEVTESKQRKVWEKIKKAGAGAFLCSRLDDVMWMFNLRGSDIACNPVAFSYAFLTEKKTVLFLQKEAVTMEVKAYLNEQQISVEGYDGILSFLENYAYQGKAALDMQQISYALYRMVEKKTEVLNIQNPTGILKAVKNPVEQQNLKEVYLRDSAALVKFIYWIKTKAGTERLTEIQAAAYLDHLRRNTEGFLDVSFPTISAYGAHAAMMHYQADSLHNAEIEAEGSYLVDSGGQYVGGTTDVTRTVVLGSISEEFRMHFTYVAVGMLRLMNARFLHGCTGRNLDILARQPLWNIGTDYKCGTGHGIGYMLNVHEGPQNIRWSYNAKEEEAVLEEGMLVSDEPGVYIQNQYGIRTENILICRRDFKSEGGQFMCFEPLTFVPIDQEAIDASLMNREDLVFFNQYHRQVYEKMAPYLEEEEKKWLKKATASLPE